MYLREKRRNILWASISNIYKTKKIYTEKIVKNKDK